MFVNDLLMKVIIKCYHSLFSTAKSVILFGQAISDTEQQVSIQWKFVYDPRSKVPVLHSLCVQLDCHQDVCSDVILPEYI